MRVAGPIGVAVACAVLGGGPASAWAQTPPTHLPAERAWAVAAPTRSNAWVARLVADVPVRGGPGTGAQLPRLPARGRRNGGPVVLLVLARARPAPDGRPWLLVRLPRRGAAHHGWVPADRAALTTTPWRIEVSLRTRTVVLLRDGRPRRTVRAVLGASATPTGTGLEAVSERVRQPRPAGFLGPWALLLTGFSPTLARFDGGPGQLALHGRGAAALAAPLGSRASHGCVRVSNATIRQLAGVAREGTPVSLR